MFEFCTLTALRNSVTKDSVSHQPLYLIECKNFGDETREYKNSQNGPNRRQRIAKRRVRVRIIMGLCLSFSLSLPPTQTPIGMRIPEKVSILSHRDHCTALSLTHRDKYPGIQRDTLLPQPRFILPKHWQEGEWDREEKREEEEEAAKRNSEKRERAALGGPLPSCEERLNVAVKTAQTHAVEEFGPCENQ